jgi:hypothetical protein
VHVVDVPGEHVAMLRPPVVQQVAAVVDAELRPLPASGDAPAVL